MRRSSRLLDARDRSASVLSPLPLALVLKVFACLTVDERARAALVSRSWRAALGDLSLWTRLDLGDDCGVRQERITDAFLLGAAAKARGQLQALTLLNYLADGRLSRDAVLDVVRANAESLTDVTDSGLGAPLFFTDVLPVLEAAPRLHALHAFVRCSPPQALTLLRRDAPYGALSCREIGLDWHGHEGGEAAILELCATLRAHLPAPRELCMYDAPLGTPAALGGLVETALFCHFSYVSLENSGLGPAAAPALAHLIAAPELRFLLLHLNELVDDVSAPILAAALRATTHLSSLGLGGVGLFRPDTAAASLVLLAAVTAHPSIACLDFSCNQISHHASAAQALGALVAADAPALEELYLMDMGAAPESLTPLVAALPGNSHLHRLDMGQNYAFHFAAFSADHLLPAVQANRSLRSLRLDQMNEAQVRAVALVSRREQMRLARTRGRVEPWHR